MSWTQSLISLYDKNIEKVGTEEIYGKQKVPFAPVFHTTAKTTYEILLTDTGNLVEIRDIPKDDAETIVPVYNGSRTSGICAHALCDKVEYLSNAINQKRHDDYMTKLKSWCESEFTHPTIQAVYSYLSKETLYNDLLSFESAKPVNLKKEDSQKKELVKKDSFIRFSILYKYQDPIRESHCWTDQTLHDSFISYRKSMFRETDLDYLSGETVFVGNLFPKGIRWSGDKTSLISSNKTDYYDLVFTGLFRTKEEAFSIGIENAYKIINALKWAIRSTGGRYGDMAVAVWNSGNIPTPDFDTDTYSLGQNLKSLSEIPEDGQDELLNESYDVDIEDSSTNISTVFSEQQVIRMLNGYRKNMPLSTTITLFAISSASEGRCSIVNYLELDGKTFLENISKWHQQGEWWHKKWITDPDTQKRKLIVFTGIPGMKDITNFVYGTEIEENGVCFVGFRSSDKNKNTFYEKTLNKLIPCIWNNAPLPYDMVRKITEKAISPLSYKNTDNWERVAALACSFYKKYVFDQKGEVLDMALDKENKDRSYLFGRCLAVADYAEKKTYNYKTDAKRVTNAKRYMNRFVKKPAETYVILREKLEPYLAKLSFYEREHIINPLFAEIGSKLSEEDYTSREKLSPLFLLGYDAQMHELRADSKTKAEGVPASIGESISVS